MIFILFLLRLEEVTAQANKFSRLIEQREEKVRNLKTRLEEAVHQNNKLTNAAELKDDKIKTLEQRSFYPYHDSGIFKVVLKVFEFFQSLEKYLNFLKLALIGIEICYMFNLLFPNTF